MKSHFFIQNLVKFRALRGRTNAAQRLQNLSIRGTRIDRFCKRWARESGAGRLRIGAAAGCRRGRWSRAGRRRGGNAVGEHKEGVEKTIGVCPPYPPAAAASAAGGQRQQGHQGQRIDTATGQHHRGSGSRGTRGTGRPAAGCSIRYRQQVTGSRGGRGSRGTRGGGSTRRPTTAGQQGTRRPAAGCSIRYRQQGQQGQQGHQATGGGLSPIARGNIKRPRARLASKKFF